jgi:hypothetical protein
MTDKYRVRSFWSPDSKHLVTAYVTNDDISLMDDDGTIWRPAGPEADMSKPVDERHAVGNFLRELNDDEECREDMSGAGQ